MKRSTTHMPWALTALAVTALCSAASGYSLTRTYSVSFTSDMLPPGLMSVETFDTNLGTLQSVTIELFHSGAVTAKADNDDPFNSAQAMARMIRAWNLSGPGLDPAVVWDYKIITSSAQTLDPDDGDGGNVAMLDPTAPDGHDFGILTYNSPAGVYNPANISLYETLGPGTVTFTVTPVLMVNDLAFAGASPDAWQMEVQDPDMTVTAKVTYTYIPEPATLSLLVLAVPFLRRKGLPYPG